MHVLKNSKPIDTRSSLMGVLQPGEWLMHDQNAFELAMMADRESVQISFLKHDRGGIRQGNILVFRSGRYGDLLLATPAFKAQLSEFPDARFSLSCFEERTCLFEGTGLFHSYLPYPLPASMLDHFDNWVSLENVMEKAVDEHATDAFAQALGVAVTDYKPVYVVTEVEEIEASMRLESIGVTSCKKIVGVQLRASVRNRDYPAQQAGKLVAGLVARGWEVLLFGEAGQLPSMEPAPHVHDLTRSGLSFRDTAAILSICDVFVGVDSALIHLCHALDVPAVGLYGPFSWQTRTSKAPLTHALTGAGDCAPCSWHIKNGHHFPPHCPTGAKGYCGVLADIKPERIVAQVDKLKS